MSSDDQHLISDLPDEIAGIFEGDVAEVHTSEREDDVLRLLREMRGQLMAAAQADGVSIREWAKRLDVSASVVSRQMRDDKDLFASTAALLAHSLGRECHVELKRKHAGLPDRLNSLVSGVAGRVRIDGRRHAENTGPRALAFGTKSLAPA